MELSKEFDFDKIKFDEIFKISKQRIEEIGDLIAEPLISSASKGRNTLKASVDFFYYLKDKNLADNELLYISFIAGAGYATIMEKAKQAANKESTNAEFI